MQLPSTSSIYAKQTIAAGAGNVYLIISFVFTAN